MITFFAGLAVGMAVAAVVFGLCVLLWEEF